MISKCDEFGLSHGQLAVSDRGIIQGFALVVERLTLT